jgi:peptidoglycan hydrolase-like protein with peptidoglycan-binding domain
MIRIETKPEYSVILFVNFFSFVSLLNQRKDGVVKMKVKKLMITTVILLPIMLLILSGCGRSIQEVIPPVESSFAELPDTAPEPEYETPVEVLPIETPAEIPQPVEIPTVAETPVEILPVVLTYSVGDTGDSIKGIQTSLNKFGFRLSVDGSFGNKTLWAVKKFQSMNNIPETGIVDEVTLDKLSLNPTKETTYVPPVTQTASSSTTNSSIEDAINKKGLSSSTNYLIWVSTNKLYTYVFTGSEGHWSLARSMKSTIGKPSTPTIKGTFKVQGKGSYFTVPDHEEWICKYYTQFYGDYLIHSVVYDKNDKLIDGRLGMRLSKGCIRVSLENAKFIYNNVPRDSTVYID